MEIFSFGEKKILIKIKGKHLLDIFEKPYIGLINIRAAFNASQFDKLFQENDLQSTVPGVR